MLPRHATNTTCCKNHSLLQALNFLFTIPFLASPPICCHKPENCTHFCSLLPIFLWAALLSSGCPNPPFSRVSKLNKGDWQDRLSSLSVFLQERKHPHCRHMQRSSTHLWQHSQFSILYHHCLHRVNVNFFLLVGPDRLVQGKKKSKPPPYL